MKQFRNTDYYATTCGKIWSEKSHKFMKQYVSHRGYARVYLCGIDGKDKYVAVHRIMAECYIPNPDNLPQVNHKDTIKLHNWYDNLEWSTCGDNIRHAYKSGAHAPVISTNVKCVLYYNNERVDNFNSKADACKYAHEHYGVSNRSLKAYGKSGKCRLEECDVTDSNK